MHGSALAEERRSLPLTYVPSALLEKLPSILGLVASGTLLSLQPEMWPGRWAWIIIAPLLALRLLGPVVSCLTFRWEYTSSGLYVRSGALQKRTRFMEWHDVRTMDVKASWAFKLFHLATVDVVQGGEEGARINIPAVRERDHLAMSEVRSRSAPQPLPEVGTAPLGSRPDANLRDATRIYKSSHRDLFVASLVYGQFAIAGSAALLGTIDLADFLGVSMDMTELSPAGTFLIFLIAAALVTLLGFSITVLRFSGFEALSHSGGGVLIRYGLLSSHERVIDKRAIAGLMIQRNLVETLLGRVRLSLLTIDSTGQLSANLVLPSLPGSAVMRISQDVFGNRVEASLPWSSKRTAIFRGLGYLSISITLPGLLALALAETTAMQAHVIGIICVTLAIATHQMTRLISSKILVSRDLGTIELSVRHVSERLVAVNATAVHLISTFRVGGLLSFSRVHFYAGMPRSLASFTFDTSDLDRFRTKVATLSPTIMQEKKKRDTSGHD